MTIIRIYDIAKSKSFFEMLLYNKRDSEIDIYHMNPKEEKLKNYRKKLLDKHDPIFYGLKTNSEDTMKRLSDDEIDIRAIEYNTSSQWSSLETDDKTKMKKKKVKPYDYEQCRIQKAMIKRYINGEYSILEPTRVFEFIIEDDLDCTIYQFLKPDCARTINQEQKFWQIENMMDLPE